MSWEALGWVWQREITPAARKLVAVAIADAASDEGVAYPSHRRLAERCGLSAETVRSHIRELEAEGIIVRTARESDSGRQTSNEYRVEPFPPGGRPPPGPLQPGGGGPLQPPHYVEPPERTTTTTPNPVVQEALLPDPVDETWELYVKLTDRPKAILTPKVRRWIADAHKAVGVEETQRAIRGLAASEYHRDNGYTGIEYAIRPKQGETIEGRVEKMAAKVPAQGADGPTTVQRLLELFPSEVRAMVAEWLRDIEAALRNPEHRGLAATSDARVRALRERGIELSYANGRIAGWEKS